MFISLPGMAILPPRPPAVYTPAEGKRALLADIPRAERASIWSILERQYREVVDFEMRVDAWPVVLDEAGTLRWKQDTMISGLLDHRDVAIADMNTLSIRMQQGRYDKLDYLRFLKRTGYSLQGYFECVSTCDWYWAWLAPPT